MPRIIGVTEEMIDIPMPANHKMQAKDFRRCVGIGDNYALIRSSDDGSSEELKSDEYVYYNDSFDLLPKHIRG